MATGDITLSNSQTGAIINSKPTGSNLNITLLKRVKMEHTSLYRIARRGHYNDTGSSSRRGNVLGEQYSSCTIYWGGDSWYGIGDLI